MSPETRPITRADIEAKFREIEGEVDLIEDEARNYGVMVAVAVVVAVVAVAFVLGRRKGRHSRTLVEIRRL